MAFASIKNKPSFVKKKLSKKWRFWRLFKKFFLFKKKKRNFSRIKLLYNQKRIIWHQLSSMYGKKIKNMIYTKHRTKKIFNVKFDKLICNLELRLNILLVRINFMTKLSLRYQNTSNIVFLVNGKKKHQNYQVKIQDVISKLTSNHTLSGNFSNFSIWKWRRHRRKQKKRFRYILRKTKCFRLYFLIRTNLIFNFIEINYFIYWGTLIRLPLLGEIIYKNKKWFLFGGLLRKIHFLY